MMRSITAVGTLALLALLATSTSCGSDSAPAASLGALGGSFAPQGSLTLSGAMTATVTAGAQDTKASCRVVKTPPLPPATAPIDVSLTGEVDFGSGSTRVVLTFLGAPTTLTLPLPGELTVPGPPGTRGDQRQRHRCVVRGSKQPDEQRHIDAIGNRRWEDSRLG